MLFKFKFQIYFQLNFMKKNICGCGVLLFIKEYILFPSRNSTVISLNDARFIFLKKIWALTPTRIKTKNPTHFCIGFFPKYEHKTLLKLLDVGIAVLLHSYQQVIVVLIVALLVSCLLQGFFFTICLYLNREVCMVIECYVILFHIFSFLFNNANIGFYIFISKPILIYFVEIVGSRITIAAVFFRHHLVSALISDVTHQVVAPPVVVFPIAPINLHHYAFLAILVHL